MNHTIRQQKMFDHVTQANFGKRPVPQEPSIMEEMLKGIGAVVLAVAVVGGAYMLWVISQDYFKYFIWSVFSK